MTGRFDGKVAIVTGASRGLGRAIALSLAGAGVAVAVNYRSEAEEADALDVLAAIGAAGGKAIALMADMTSMKAIEKLFADSLSQLGQPDFVISNVGGPVRMAPIAQFDEALFDAVMALNAKSSFFVLQAAARHVRDGGRIIAMSSSTASAPYEGTAGYAGAKAAVEIFCKVLAREVGQRGITVNSVAPGLTMTEAMKSAVLPAGRVEQVIAATPLGRLGEPQDIADSIMMLLSPESHWITGQSIKAGGGIQ